MKYFTFLFIILFSNFEAFAEIKLTNTENNQYAYKLYATSCCPGENCDKSPVITACINPGASVAITQLDKVADCRNFQLNESCIWPKECSKEDQEKVLRLKHLSEINTLNHCIPLPKDANDKGGNCFSGYLDSGAQINIESAQCTNNLPSEFLYIAHFQYNSNVDDRNLNCKKNGCKF